MLCYIKITKRDGCLEFLVKYYEYCTARKGYVPWFSVSGRDWGLGDVCNVTFFSLLQEIE